MQFNKEKQNLKIIGGFNLEDGKVLLMHGGIVNPLHISHQPLAIKLAGAFRVTETLTRRITNE
tara:strand:- start:275 stop:463 length:189 start_codon:yes stop_codon:yes gene_type:complete